MKRRCVPRPVPTLFVVQLDGTIEQVRFRSLRTARAAARSFSDTSCRCAFAMLR